MLAIDRLRELEDEYRRERKGGAGIPLKIRQHFDGKIAECQSVIDEYGDLVAICDVCDKPFYPVGNDRSDMCSECLDAYYENIDEGWRD